MSYSVVKWSNSTLVLYFFMGLVCFMCIHYAKKRELNTGIPRKITNKEYYPWYAMWLVMAVLRCVNSAVGGQDALSYISYFETCLDRKVDTTDLAFKLFNQAIRLITDNYHVFFLIYYTIIIFSLVFFINEFSRAKSSSIPMIILFYLFLRSFTSMRSNFAIAIILIALVFLHRKKYLWAVIFSLIAIFTHVMAFMYVAFLLFYFFYHDRKIGIAKSLFYFFIAFIVGTYIQTLMTHGVLEFLSDVGTGAYVSYAQRSLTKNFVLDYSASNIPQLALFLTMVIFKKQINYTICNASEEDKSKLEFIKLMAYYDFLMIPAIFILDIYRGYEFFYVARLIMWGEIIIIIRKYFTPKSKIAINVFFVLVFCIWTYGRIQATWESSHLMPYVFELFK